MGFGGKAHFLLFWQENTLLRFGGKTHFAILVGKRVFSVLVGKHILAFLVRKCLFRRKHILAGNAFYGFGEKTRFVGKTSFSVWGEDAFLLFWRETRFYNFGEQTCFGGKTFFYGYGEKTRFGEKMRFCNFGRKTHFTILVEKCVLRLWRESAFLRS